MEKSIKELVKLAEKWSQFSQDAHGWQVEEYRDREASLRVRCYFDHGGDHNSITFGDDGVHDLEISFFKPVTISFGIQYAKAQKLKDTLKVYTGFLIQMRAQHKKRSEEEIEELKQAEIKRLEIELKRLKT